MKIKKKRRRFRILSCALPSCFDMWSEINVQSTRKQKKDGDNFHRIYPIHKLSKKQNPETHFNFDRFAFRSLMLLFVWIKIKNGHEPFSSSSMEGAQTHSRDFCFRSMPLLRFSKPISSLRFSELFGAILPISRSEPLEQRSEEESMHLSCVLIYLPSVYLSL